MWYESQVKTYNINVNLLIMKRIFKLILKEIRLFNAQTVYFSEAIKLLS